MKKLGVPILFVLFLLVVPIGANAQQTANFVLPPEENWGILHAVRTHFTDQDVLLFAHLTGEEQAAVVTVRGAINKGLLGFLPGFVATETVTAVIKAASFFSKITEASTKELLAELEKRSVQETTQRSLDWLFGQEIRTGSGHLTDDNTGAQFQYVLLFQDARNDKADIVVRFYSPDRFDPGTPTASVGVGRAFFADELSKGGTVRPFIMTVTAQVERTGLGWTVNQNPRMQVEIEFPDQVPRLALSKELPYPLEEKKREVQNLWAYVRRIIGALENTGTELGQRAGEIADNVEELAGKAVALITPGNDGSIVIQTEKGGTQTITREEAVDALLKDTELQGTSDETELQGSPEAQFQEDAPESPQTQQSGEPGEAELQGSSEVPPQQREEVPARTGTEQKQSGETEPQGSPDTRSLAQQSDGSNEIDQTPGEPEGLASPKWCQPDNASTAAHDSAVFSKVAWMGTENSANDEWILLQNWKGAVVELENWQVADKDGSIQVLLENFMLSPNGTILLERTDDASYPAQAADIIYKGALRNSNEALYLFDETCTLQDRVLANPDWPGGDNSTKTPMERNGDYTWGPSPQQAQARAQAQAAAFAGGGAGGGPSGSSGNDEEEGEEETAAACEPNSIDVNTASAEELEALQGIGPVLAGRIVEEREANGTYSSLGDLTRVSGIGEGKVEGIQEQGCAYASSASDGGNQAQNSSSEALAEEDTTPPTAEFFSLAATQTDTIFSLAWNGEDILGQVTPSGLDAFSLTYQVTPSQDGVFLTYYLNESWNDWEQDAAGTITLDSATTVVSVSAQDGISYLFSLKATDKQGNESEEDTAQTAIELTKAVVINELAWMGTTASPNDEWLELYNRSSKTIDLTEWSIYGADTEACLNFADADNASDSAALSLETEGYFVYGNGEGVLKDGNGISLVDIWDATLGLNNENPGQLALYDQKDCTGSPLDEVYHQGGKWFAGNNTDKRTMERRGAALGGSDPANWRSNLLVTRNGKDSGGNAVNGTPGAENSVSRNPIPFGAFPEEFTQITLPSLGVPYYTNSAIVIPAGKTLVVDPGVTMEFEDSVLSVVGTLQAAGTEDSKITFTSKNGQGVWKGIWFEAGSSASKIEHALLEDAAVKIGAITFAIRVEESSPTLKNIVFSENLKAGKIYLKNSDAILESITASGTNLDASSPALRIEGGSPTIKSSTFDTNSIGIRTEGLAGAAVIEGNTFSGNNQGVWIEGAVGGLSLTENSFQENTFPVFVGASTVQSGIAGLTFSSNTAENNTHDGIYVEGNSMLGGQTVTLKTNSLPYVTDAITVPAASTLVLEPGGELRLYSSGTPRFGELVINGTLTAEGAADQPIAITQSGSAGAWKRIYFPAGSTGSLKHMSLAGGGSAGGATPANPKAALYVEGGAVSVDTIEISNSVNAAIYKKGGSLTGSGATLKNNKYAFHLNENTDCPNLTAVTLENNEDAFYPSYITPCVFAQE